MNASDIIVEAVFNGRKADSEAWLERVMKGAVAKFPITHETPADQIVQHGCAKIKILEDGNFLNNSYQKFIKSLTREDLQLFVELAKASA